MATGNMGAAVGRGVEELELREDRCLDRAVGASRAWPGKHQIGQPQTGGDGTEQEAVRVDQAGLGMTLETTVLGV